LGALLSTLAMARGLEAAAFDLNDATWEGCAELLDLARRELGKDRVVVLSTLDWEEVKGSDGVMVLHPTRPIDAEEAAAFMRAGGRMAILDDYGRGDKLLSHFRIHRRVLPTHPVAFLRGKPSLPIATPAFDSDGREVLGLHPTVADVKQVVLNHGTGLRHPQLTPVLEVRAAGAPPVAVAVAGQIEGPNAKGRLFAMGDPSAFINLMLRYPGNRTFASGLVHYLADGDATDPRKGRLFVVANEFGERGSFGGVTPFRKTLDRKLRALAEAFEELRDEGFPWWLHVAVAAAVALLVLWWTVRVLGRLYQSRVPRFARAIPLVAQGGVAGRVAVLSSGASPPALALLELRSALAEALAQHLGVSSQTSPAELVQEVKRRDGLSAQLEGRITQMLSSMRAAETAVVAGGAQRVTRDEVKRAAGIVEQLLEGAGVEIPWPAAFAQSGGDESTGGRRR
ncbi:MAG: DUF4350 domain-containing protein, partial [Deltaproteobacteria bacterium]